MFEKSSNVVIKRFFNLVTTQLGLIEGFNCIKISLVSGHLFYTVNIEFIFFLDISFSTINIHELIKIALRK